MLVHYYSTMMWTTAKITAGRQSTTVISLLGKCLFSRGRTTFGRVLFSSTTRRDTSDKPRARYNQPISCQDLPRCGGIASMYRLPVQDNTDGRPIFVSKIDRSLVRISQSVAIHCNVAYSVRWSECPTSCIRQDTQCTYRVIDSLH